MLCVSNMFGVVVSAILLSTVTDLTHGLYVPHPELQRAVVHKKVIATWDEAKLSCEKEGEYTKLSTGSYYKVHHNKKSWNDASSTCTAEGGYLVVLNNEKEARAVTEYAFALTSSPYLRIGIQNGGWHSVHGEPLNQIYHTWASTRSYFYQACGVLKYDGLLDDMGCEYELEFVCEKSCPN